MRHVIDVVVGVIHGTEYGGGEVFNLNTRRVIISYKLIGYFAWAGRRWGLSNVRRASRLILSATIHHTNTTPDAGACRSVARN